MTSTVTELGLEKYLEDYMTLEFFSIGVLDKLIIKLVPKLKEMKGIEASKRFWL